MCYCIHVYFESSSHGNIAVNIELGLDNGYMIQVSALFNGCLLCGIVNCCLG